MNSWLDATHPYQEDKVKEIIVANSFSIEKAKITLNTLIVALFYDLSIEKELKIPTQAEKRERKLQDLIKKRKMPVAFLLMRPTIFTETH